MTLSTKNTTTRPVVFPVVATTAQSRVHADAKDRGFTQGHAAGYAAGLQLAGRESALALDRHKAAHEALMSELEARHEAELQALHHAVHLAVTALQERTTPVLANAEQVLFSHALELAEALLGCELRDGETSARTALSRACESGPTDVPLSIRMHPADLSELTEASRGALGLPASVQLVADPSLDRGDAVANYPHGFLDARLGAAMARAKAVLLGENMLAPSVTDNP